MKGCRNYPHSNINAHRGQMQMRIWEHECKCTHVHMHTYTYAGRSCQLQKVKQWRGILIWMGVIHAHVVELFMLFMLLWCLAVFERSLFWIELAACQGTGSLTLFVCVRVCLSVSVHVHVCMWWQDLPTPLTPFLCCADTEGGRQVITLATSPWQLDCR